MIIIEKKNILESLVYAKHADHGSFLPLTLPPPSFFFCVQGSMQIRHSKKTHALRKAPRQFLVLSLCFNVILFCLVRARTRENGVAHAAENTGFVAFRLRQLPSAHESSFSTAHAGLDTQLEARTQAPTVENHGALLPGSKKNVEQNQFDLAIDAANAAAEGGRLEDWMAHVNVYLERYESTPLHLAPSPGPLLSRLTPAPLPSVDGGPLVTVIMVTRNAEDTVEYAALSILRQTWKSLELIIVDDASTDRTWSLLTNLSQLDPRVKLVRNQIQVGPYVSRNRVLGIAAGAYVTTQDADDWALPRRVEIQVKNLVGSSGQTRANMMYMLRVQPSGVVSTGIPSYFSPDGVARQAYVSAMYETRLLREDLGYWDSVLYGADGEMIRRAQTFLGQGFAEINNVGVFLADRSNSLGKQGYNADPHAIRDITQGWVGSNRESYKNEHDAWHLVAVGRKSRALYLPFPLYERPFPAPPDMVVALDRVCECVRGTPHQCV